MQALDTIASPSLRVPLTVPYRLAFGPVEHFDTIIAEAVDCDGNGGFGEATILTGYTDETIDDSWRAAKAFARRFVAAATALEADRAAGREVPVHRNAFGTALEMLSGSALLALDADASVPLVGPLNAKDEAAMRRRSRRGSRGRLSDDQGEGRLRCREGHRAGRGTQKVVRGRAALRLDANQAYTATRESAS
jgi:L-alanine-DL-glutamate epimerase-like enolase superfamily enzyme